MEDLDRHFCIFFYWCCLGLHVDCLKTKTNQKLWILQYKEKSLKDIPSVMLWFTVP